MAEREYVRDDDGKFAAGHAQAMQAKHGGSVHSDTDGKGHTAAVPKAGATPMQIHDTLVKHGFNPQQGDAHEAPQYDHQDGTQASVHDSGTHHTVRFAPRDYVRENTTLGRAAATHQKFKSGATGKAEGGVTKGSVQKAKPGEKKAPETKPAAAAPEAKPGAAPAAPAPAPAAPAQAPPAEDYLAKAMEARRGAQEIQRKLEALENATAATGKTPEQQAAHARLTEAFDNATAKVAEHTDKLVEQSLSDPQREPRRPLR